jgi:hypothetical protein
MTGEGWHRAFNDLIPLSGGRRLVTLRDANYIMRLPKVEHDAPVLRVAMVRPAEGKPVQIG